MTSNRTREVHEALKRRCLYQWIDYPSVEKELLIVKTKLPHINDTLAQQLCNMMQFFREGDYYKKPGIAETLDWGLALIALGRDGLNQNVVDETLGCIFKFQDDIQRAREVNLSDLVNRAKLPPDTIHEKIGDDESVVHTQAASVRVAYQFIMVNQRTLLQQITVFCRLLKQMGVNVTTTNHINLCRSLEWIDIRQRGDFYHAAKTNLIANESDLPLFDAAFNLFWKHPPPRLEGIGV